MTKIEAENKIQSLNNQVKQKLRDRGEAIRNGGGWHDNAEVDAINMEIYVLQAKVKELNKQILELNK